MRADRVEASWDPAKSKWLIRIQSGEEVIRRHCDAARNADDAAIRAAAETTARDEGYEVDAANIVILREQAANHVALHALLCLVARLIAEQDEGSYGGGMLDSVKIEWL